ncbi:MAG: hypothetical protein WKF37_01155 [Bryobacteraceae bacterium]
MLSGLPEFAALPVRCAAARCNHASLSFDRVCRAAWDEAKYGKPSQSPLLELTIPTHYDPSLAPPGKHIMGVFLQYAPYTLAKGSWDSIRDAYAERVLDVIEQYVPRIRSLIIEKQVLTPLDLERKFGITGGNIFHGEIPDDVRDAPGRWLGRYGHRFGTLPLRLGDASGGDGCART